MKVGFYRDALIGDNLVSINAMYAIKALYPSSTLIVYTNTIGAQLYEQYDFIDELFNMDSHSHSEIKAHIDSHGFDFFILTQANRWRCDLIHATNAKKIISLLSIGNIFKSRFQTLFISRNFSSIPQYQRMLRLTREIDPKIFDANIAKIDFSPILLRTQHHNQQFIHRFLSAYANYTTLIMLNPFSRTCSHNLTLQAWMRLAERLALSYPHFLFLIPTYPDNPQRIELIHQRDNLAIFFNTSDLFNLVELISRLSLLISPSTGNIHIANNLKIPTIGVFSKRDTILWRGENMDHFIIIPAKQQKLTYSQEETLINQICDLFKKLLHPQIKETNTETNTRESKS